MYLQVRGNISTAVNFQEDNDLKKLADSMKEQSAGIAKLVEERERIGGGFFGPGVLELCQAADIVYIGLHGANGERR